MSKRNIKQSVILPCTPKSAYEAWMDSKMHGEMVNGSAKIDPTIRGKFSIWEGAATGKTLELDPKKLRIVQEWRYDYSDWPEDKPSIITLAFVAYKNNQCHVQFRQTGVPSNHAEEISQRWKDYYWEPMKKYFESKIMY